MSRFHAFVFVALALFCPAVSWGSDLISDEVARQHGLARAWFSQAQVDRSTGQISAVVVDEGTVFVQTDQAMLQAIDAVTGQSLWVASVGERGHPTVAPGANSRMVATVSGSTLVVLNRFNGRLLWKTQLEGSPGSAPALSEERLYLPLTNGMLMSFRLKELRDAAKDLGNVEKPGSTPEEQAAREAQRRESLTLDQKYIAPLAYQSPGRTLVQPIITRETPDEEFLAWTTEKGFMLVAKVNRMDQKAIQLVYRLETGGPIATPPIYRPGESKKGNEGGTLLVASEDGYVYAIREKDGQQLWRYSTGEAITQPLATVANVVLVPNQMGGLNCLNVKDGDRLWWSPNVTQFLAVSKERIYVTDKQNRLLVLDLRTGSLIDTIPAPEMMAVKAINHFNDRLILATKSGLVQCLHEVELSDPVVHRARPKLAPTTTFAAKAASKEAGEKKHEPASSKAPSVASSGGGSAKKKSRAPTASDMFGAGGGGGAGGKAAGKKTKRGAAAFGAEAGGMEMPGMGGAAPGGKVKGGKRARNMGAPMP